jgi:hypothetical protein
MQHYERGGALVIAHKKAREGFVMPYIQGQQHLQTETELTENGNFRLFSANEIQLRFGSIRNGFFDFFRNTIIASCWM